MPRKRERKCVTSPRQRTKGPKKDLVSVILLGDQHGYRMRSYGPTALIEVKGQTVLEHQINAIKSVFGKFEIVLCCGFEADKVITFVNEHLSHEPIRIVENQLYNNSNCCESTRLCLNNIANDKIIVVQNGVMITPDVITEADIYNSCILTTSEEDENFNIGVISNDHRFESMNINTTGDSWVNVMTLIGHEDISEFNRIISMYQYKTKFLFEAMNEAQGKVSFKVINVSNESINMLNHIKNLQRIKK